MKGPYKPPKKTTRALSMIYLRRISLSAFAIETSNKIVNDIFPTRVLNYNLRSQTDFFRSIVKISKFGLNSLKYLASKVWKIFCNKSLEHDTKEIKNFSSVEM